MKEFDSSVAALKGNPEQLSRMINLAEGWSEQDLPAMFEHQMAARLDFDLENLKLQGAAAASRDEALPAAATTGVVTFRDLIFHLQPSLALLKLAKDFFKQQAGSSDNRRPEEQVAYAMYLLSVIVGRLRLGISITRLKDPDLLRGVRWATERKWLDGQVKALLRQAGERLSAGTGPGA